jgi:O-antigen/teichoic acid export membrane protein
MGENIFSFLLRILLRINFLANVLRSKANQYLRASRINVSDFSLFKLSSFFSLFIANISALIIGVLSSVIINRSLTLPERADFALILNSQTLLSSFLCLGLPTAINYVHIHSNQALQWFAFVFCSILSLALSCAIFLPLTLLASWFPVLNIVKNFWLELFLLVILGNWFGLLRGFQLAREDISDFSKLNFYFRFLTLIVIGVFSFLHSFNLAHLNWITICTQFVVLSFFVARTWQPFNLGDLYYAARTPNFFTVGFRHMWVSLLLLLIRRIDLFFIDQKLGKEETALYTVAISIFAIFENFTGSIGMLIANNSAKTASLSYYVTRKTAIYVTLVLAIALSVFLLFGEYFIPILYGQKYFKTYSYFLILSPFFLVTTYTGIIGNAIAGKGYPKGYISSHIFTLVITIPAHYVFISHFGLNGLAFSLFLVNIFFVNLLSRVARNVLT